MHIHDFASFSLARKEMALYGNQPYGQYCLVKSLRLWTGHYGMRYQALGHKLGHESYYNSTKHVDIGQDLQTLITNYNPQIIEYTLCKTLLGRRD